MSYRGNPRAIRGQAAVFYVLMILLGVEFIRYSDDLIGFGAGCGIFIAGVCLLPFTFRHRWFYRSGGR